MPRSSRLAVLPPLAVALLIAFFGTNVPFWDEWDLATLLEKLARHQATLADFFVLQSEHRFVVPKLILAPLALATHWNVIAELWLSFAVAVAGYIGLLVLLRRADAARIIVTSLAYFSLAAYENWLWGWQLSWFLTITLFIWAVVAAGTIENRALQIASAAPLCILATFSSAYGIVSWIALAPILWQPAAHRLSAMAAWLVMFLASLGIYLHGFHVTPSSGSVLLSIPYAIAVIGSPLSRASVVAVLCGVLLVSRFAILATRAWRQRDREALHWIPLGLFAIAFAAVNAIGRSGLGLPQALSSRYLTPASLLLIAVVNLEQRFRRLVLVAVSAALIVQSLTSIPIAWQIKRSRDQARLCLDLLLVNDSADCTAPLAPSSEMLRNAALATHRIGLRPLVTSSDFVVTPEARGSIDAVSPPPAIHATGRVELPARGLYAIAATVQGMRRIVAADLVGGAGTFAWSLDLPPHVVQRSGAFEVWLFVPGDRKLYRLPGAMFPKSDRADRQN